jgi:hypothetical protein
MTDSVNKQLYDVRGKPLSHSPYIEMALGNVRGRTLDQKFGFNQDIDIDSSAAETAWAPGGRISYLTTARTMSVVSSDADDASGDTGARTVLIQGVDENFLEVEETITMNGTTPVVTIQTFLRINRMVVVTAGSSEMNEGTITATATTDATVQGSIPAGHGFTQQLVIAVPANKTLLFTGLFWNAVKDAGGQDPVVNVRILRRLFETGVRGQIYERTFDTGVLQLIDEPVQPRPVAGPADLEVIVSSTENNLQFYGSIDFVLVEN